MTRELFIKVQKYHNEICFLAHSKKNKNPFDKIFLLKKYQIKFEWRSQLKHLQKPKKLPDFSSSHLHDVIEIKQTSSAVAFWQCELLMRELFLW